MNRNFIIKISVSSKKSILIAELIWRKANILILKNAVYTHNDTCILLSLSIDTAYINQILPVSDDEYNKYIETVYQVPINEISDKNQKFCSCKEIKNAIKASSLEDLRVGESEIDLNSTNQTINLTTSPIVEQPNVNPFIPPSVEQPNVIQQQPIINQESPLIESNPSLNLSIESTVVSQNSTVDQLAVPQNSLNEPIVLSQSSSVENTVVSQNSPVENNAYNSSSQDFADLNKEEVVQSKKSEESKSKLKAENLDTCDKNPPSSKHTNFNKINNNKDKEDHKINLGEKEKKINWQNGKQNSRSIKNGKKTDIKNTSISLDDVRTPNLYIRGIEISYKQKKYNSPELFISKLKSKFKSEKRFKSWGKSSKYTVIEKGKKTLLEDKEKIFNRKIKEKDHK